jgi:hypothetical protein
MAVDTRPTAPGPNLENPDLEQLRSGDPIPPLRADDHSDADPAVETPVEARQGFLGRPVLVVLIAGLVLAIVAWVAVDMLVY